MPLRHWFPFDYSPNFDFICCRLRNEIVSSLKIRSSLFARLGGWPTIWFIGTNCVTLRYRFECECECMYRGWGWFQTQRKSALRRPIHFHFHFDSALFNYLMPGYSWKRDFFGWSHLTHVNTPFTQWKLMDLPNSFCWRTRRTRSIDYWVAK